jgi:hypothetical protein
VDLNVEDSLVKFMEPKRTTGFAAAFWMKWMKKTLQRMSKSVELDAINLCSGSQIICYMIGFNYPMLPLNTLLLLVKSSIFSPVTSMLMSMPSTEELRSTETWSNLLPMILKAGRTTHLEPVGMEEEEATALKEKLETEDP